MVSTDLSSAFDTVNHRILIKKLEYYRIKGRILKLLESYLSRRYQYTEVDNIQSKIEVSPACSVIQGSKLSGLLYLIYTNEVGKLQQLMKDKKWMEEKLKTKPE